MNILLGVHKFFPAHRTGTEVLTLELARGLRRRGHSVSVVAGEPHTDTTAANCPWLDRDLYDDIPVLRLHYDNGWQGDPLRAHFDAPDRLRLVGEVIDNLRPDLVHFNHLRAFSSRVVPELKKRGLPVVFTPTDFWAVCPKFQLYRDFDENLCQGPVDISACLRCCQPMPAWLAHIAVSMSRTPFKRLSRGLTVVDSLRQRLERVITDINQANLIVPASNFLAETLIRHGVDQKKMRVVPFGVDIGELPEKCPVPRPFTQDAPLRLGFIGSLSAMKGPHVILSALHELGEDGRRVTLDIYGKVDTKDPYVRNLEDMARPLGAAVKFCGTFPHEQIGAVLRQMHVLIVPSIWYENTPLVLCSALASGVFVLVSNLGGMTEAVAEGLTGLSFDAGNSADLIRQLYRLLDEEVPLAKLPPAHLRRCRATADYVLDIESLYRKVLEV